MNAYMIKKWNGKVRKNDEVVIIGDFSFGTAEQTNELLQQLNGKLYLITGNHDRFVKQPEIRKPTCYTGTSMTRWTRGYWSSFRRLPGIQ